MKAKITIIILFLPILSFGQYFGINNISDSIKRVNKVYKCTEYNIEDSIAFFKEYKNAFYSIFDSEGKIVEKNAYSTIIKGANDYSSHEFTIFFIYDDKDRNIMSISYDTSCLHKINRIRTNEYDSLGNLYGYRDFSSEQNYPSAYEIHNYWKYDHPDPIEIIDSVVSNSKKEFYHFYTEDRIDTIEFTTYYYSNSRVDSIVSYFNKERHSDLYIYHYIYYESNTIKQYEYKSYDYKRQHYSINRTVYLNNGLPMERWYINDYDGNKSNIHTRFLYEYNTKQ